MLGFIQQLKGYDYCRFFFAVVFLSGLILPSVAKGQNETDEVIRVDSNLVQLNVGVVDQKGTPVLNLNRSDFIVYEDEVPQTILSFEPTVAPFSVVILLDTSGSTLGFRQQLKFAALRFVDALGAEDRAAVVSFNTKTELMTNFTTDRQKIAFGINAANGRNGTKLFEALEYAAKLLSKEKNRRKAIVVLTDGIDSDLRNEDRQTIGQTTIEAEIFSAVKPMENNKLRRVLSESAAQGITIYPLVLPSGDPNRLADPTPIQVAVYKAAGERVLALANQTGGRLHSINRLEEMGQLYVEVAADLRRLYSLSYQSSAENKNWRSIRIEVQRPELIARTRTGYFVKQKAE